MFYHNRGTYTVAKVRVKVRARVRVGVTPMSRQPCITLTSTLSSVVVVVSERQGENHFSLT